MAGQGVSGVELVLFSVAATRCAMPRADVAELLPLPHLFRPPTAPAVVAGFFSLGGRATAVLDAAKLLAIDPGDPSGAAVYRHLVLLRHGFALLVDRVTDVVTLPADSVAPVSDAETLNGCVTGVVDRGDGLVHVVAADRLLLARERLRLSALLDAAAARISDWGSEP